MRFGRRHPDAEASVPPAEPAPAADEHVPPSWTQDDDEPTVEAAVVDADAVELPAEEPAAAEPAAVEPTDVAPAAEPAYVESAAEPAYVESAAESAGVAAAPEPAAAPPAAVAPSVEPATFRPAAVAVAPPGEHGAFAHGAPPAVPLSSWQEPLRELADQRPEYAVGAAFAGGILAAMIIRRLGS